MSLRTIINPIAGAAPVRNAETDLAIQTSQFQIFKGWNPDTPSGIIPAESQYIFQKIINRIHISSGSCPHTGTDHCRRSGQHVLVPFNFYADPLLKCSKPPERFPEKSVSNSAYAKILPFEIRCRLPALKNGRIPGRRICFPYPADPALQSCSPFSSSVIIQFPCRMKNKRQPGEWSE